MVAAERRSLGKAAATKALVDELNASCGTPQKAAKSVEAERQSEPHMLLCGAAFALPASPEPSVASLQADLQALQARAPFKR